MERSEDGCREELLSEEGKRGRSVTHIRPSVLLTVTLLNVFLLASTVVLAIYMTKTSVVVVNRRHARQQDRDPGSFCPPYLQCCQSLDRNIFRQLCIDFIGTTTTTPGVDGIRTTAGPPLPTPPSTSPNTGPTKRMTPVPTARPTTTTTTNTTSPATTTSALDNSYNKLRLPRNILPSHYNIHWKPDFYQDDYSKFTLEGNVDIFFRCYVPTSIVSLNTRQLVVDRPSIKVTSRYDNVPIALTNVTEDTTTEVFNITLERWLSVGEEIVVSMRFNGHIYSNPMGIYWGEYSSAAGPRYIVSTQMQTTDARRAFPCVDDPDAKATFTLAVERQPQVFTLANTPINYTTTSNGSPGWLVDVFETTQPMSTYLVAFAISTFSGINTTTNGLSHTKIGLWAQDSYKTAGFLDYAAVVSAGSVEFFEEYFNYSFKWPKLDMLAMPKLSFGGMENWGLITYQISLFLFDPEYSDSDDKLGVTGIIAHEILHNWLGNTVTIKWWDDLWLTEGTARYFQYVATQAVQPSWDAEQLFIVKDFQAKALWLDDSGASKPLYNPALYTNYDLDAAFNTYTYSKGACIIRMLSKLIVGEDVFHEVMKSYVLKYQYGNVDHDDLIESVSQAYLASGKPTDFNLKDVLLTWIEQMGFPLVTVSKATNDSSDQLLSVTQRMYLYQPNDTVDDYYQSPFGYLWEIPVSYMTSLDSTPVRVWMHKVTNMNIQLAQPLTVNDWILVNLNLYGYYRVNYDEANWRLLATQLKSDRTRIPVNNRGQLIDDSFTLSMSGNVSQLAGLRLTEYLASETEYLPWTNFVDNMLPVFRRFRDNSMFSDRLQNYILSLLLYNYNTLGWEAKTDDNITVTFLRRIIIETTCSFDYDPCINEALNRFQLYRANAFNNSLITPDQRFAVYCTVAAHGSYDDWQVLVTRYKATKKDFNDESNKLVEAMTCTRNSTTIKRLLDSVQAQDTSFVDSSDFYYMRYYIARSKKGYMAAWEHLYNYGAATIGRVDILRAFSNVISTKTEADRFDSYIVQYPAANSYETDTFQSLRQTIQQNINWRQRNMQDMNDWLTGLNF